jgi:hypothetical protein
VGSRYGIRGKLHKAEGPFKASTVATALYLPSRDSLAMASDAAQVSYADEKQLVSHAGDAATTSTESDLELRHELTFQGVDMHNTKALKGDDSDGKVEWNMRSIFAAIFLAALYTGEL